MITTIFDPAIRQELLELQKKSWIENVQAYANYSNPRFVHDFFGKMTDEQIGIFAYKHADHHLRQFGV